MSRLIIHGVDLKLLEKQRHELERLQDTLIEEGRGNEALASVVNMLTVWSDERYHNSERLLK